MAKISKTIFYFNFFWVLNSSWGSEKDRQESSDFGLSSVQIIRKYGYPVEVHTVETEDGYILELHRIPHGKNSTATHDIPMLLIHGFMGTSSQYLLRESESLSLVLPDAGYDVWMINLRGCKYSKKHRVLTPRHMKFWDFSWHEHGVYDIPATIDYVLKYTKRQQLLFVGYSMGTTSFFVMTSERPEYQKKIRGAILIGPTAYMGHAKTPFRYIAPLSKTFQGGLELVEHEKIFGDDIIHRFSVKDCEKNILCRTMIFLLSVSDSTLFQNKIIPTVASHMPASTSLKTLGHYGQLITSGRFQQFDYGTIRNFIKYRKFEPPEYNLKATTLPLSLFVSPNDYFNSRTDTEHTLRQLSNIKNMYIVPEHSFTHLDFIVHPNAKELVYKKVVQQAQFLINHGQN